MTQNRALRLYTVAARHARFTLALLLAVAGAAAAADTHPWPQRPVRILAGQQAGSATDNLARIVIAPATEPDIRYDPVKDFVPVGRFAHVPFGFAVHTMVPARTLGELAELARAQPGKLTYVTLGPATSTAFGMTMFLNEAGVDMLAVEYRGISSALPDVLSGRVDMLFNEVALLAQHGQQGGNLRILAIASPRRTARLPAVATTAEQGFPRVVIAPWYGLLAPADTPPDVLKRLSEAYRSVVRSPAVRNRIEALGYEPIDDAPGQFAAALRNDIASIRATQATSGKTPPR